MTEAMLTDADLDRMRRQVAAGNIAAGDLVALMAAASSRIAELEAVVSDLTTETLRLARDRAHVVAERLTALLDDQEDDRD